jgi:hypothetical protein
MTVLERVSNIDDLDSLTLPTPDFTALGEVSRMGYKSF